MSSAEQQAIAQLHTLPSVRKQVLEPLLSQGPSEIVPSLLRSKATSLQTIKDLKGVIGHTDAWKDIQAEAMHQLVDNPAQIRKIAKESMRQLFSHPDQVHFLDELSHWYHASSARSRLVRPEASTGVQTVTVSQLGSGITLTVGGLAGMLGSFGPSTQGGYGPPAAVLAGAGILISPAVVARMVTNPKVARWLAEGFSTPAGTQEATRLLSQILPRYYEAAKEEAQPSSPVPAPIRRATEGTRNQMGTNRPSVPAPIQKAIGAGR